MLPIARLRMAMPSNRFVKRPRQAAGAVSRSSANTARNAAEAPTPMTRRARSKAGNPTASPQATTLTTRRSRPAKITTRVP
jgi:hypothetical protein